MLVNPHNLFYLATPYSHPDPEVREARFHLACDAAAMLLKGGTHVYSPIAHTHPIAVRHDLPKGFDAWTGFDAAMISRCDGLIVVMADGWEQSRGVAGEINIANSLLKPLFFIDWPTTYEGWLRAFMAQRHRLMTYLKQTWE